MKQTIVTSETLHTIDFTPTVIIGFYQSTQDKHFETHFEKLRERFPDVDVIGCSSESNIYNELPYIDKSNKHLCVYICLDIRKEAYQIKLHEIDHVMEEREKEEKGYGALMFCSRYFSSLECLISTLQERDGYRPLLGAIAGTKDHKQPHGTIFYNGHYFGDHVLLWLIDQKCYRLEGKSAYHFQPVGFEMEVTKAEKTVLYEIENRPALEVLEEIVGDISMETIDSFDHPFFLKENSKIPFAHSPLCSILSIDEDNGSISLYRSVNKHAKLKVGVSLGREEQEQQLKTFKVFKRRKNAVAFLFNCVGIKANLGLMEFVYLMDLKRTLHVPFIGFHSFGEIGSINPENISMLHNQTISIAVLSEREDESCS